VSPINKMTRYSPRLRKFLRLHVLHAQDTAHQIALGAALATFVSILPVIGMQTFVAIALAALFRANKAICVPLVWISNPITTPAIIVACLAVGRAELPTRDMDTGELISMHAQVTALFRYDHGLASIFYLKFWSTLLTGLFSLGVELWVGSAVIGALLGVVAYFLTRWIVNTYRAKHHMRRQRRLQLRMKRKHAFQTTSS